jgi:hypothetical protein
MGAKRAMGTDKLEPAHDTAPERWAGWWPPMPTGTPHKCPVCSGRGEVSQNFYNISPYAESTTGVYPITCRTCNGQGVLWEP